MHNEDAWSFQVLIKFINLLSCAEYVPTLHECMRVKGKIENTTFIPRLIYIHAGYLKTAKYTKIHTSAYVFSIFMSIHPYTHRPMHTLHSFLCCLFLVRRTQRVNSMHADRGVCSVELIITRCTMYYGFDLHTSLGTLCCAVCPWAGSICCSMLEIYT